MIGRNLVLAATLAVLLAPLAAAGDHAHPEIADPGDDVQVGGGANCQVAAGPCLAGMDFFWHNADLELVWVNDTADVIVLSMELRASEGFSQDSEGGGALGRADAFTYTYTFSFTVGGAAYTAVATVDDALAVTPGGVAAGASVAGRDLTVTVPKAALDSLPAAGDRVTGLSLAMHGESTVSGVTLDDRAPDANAGPDYVLAFGPGNGTVPDDGGLKMPAPAAPLLLGALALAGALLRRRD